MPPSGKFAPSSGQDVPGRMTTVDYILIATVLLSMLFGAIRGFLRESVALLGWLVGPVARLALRVRGRALPGRGPRGHRAAGLGRPG